MLQSKKWQWRHSLPTWLHGEIFWRYLVSLVKCSYWSIFHVNMITGSGVVTIFFYKGLIRNPEMGNSPIYVLPNSFRPGEVGIPNLARMSLMKCHWMQQNARVTAFTVSKILRKSNRGGVGGKVLFLIIHA